MKPLWKVRSGNFAGWRSDNDLLYKEDGINAGYFVGDIAYSSNGFYIGEIYKDEWIGKRLNVDYPLRAARVPRAGITDAPQPGRAGLSLDDWKTRIFERRGYCFQQAPHIKACTLQTATA